MFLFRIENELGCFVKIPKESERLMEMNHFQLHSSLIADSDDFKANIKWMQERWQEVKNIQRKMRESEKKKATLAKQRKILLPRERLQLLLDEESDFLELMACAGYQMYGDTDGAQAGGSVIAGIGFVSGVKCMIIVMNWAIKGGTLNSVSVKKTMRLQEIALEMKLPTICLTESGGGDLSVSNSDPWQGSTYIEAGRCFYNQARLSAAGIPQITVVHGNATAGGAYQPGLSDYIILIRKQSQIFLGGPPLVKAATGEETTSEKLGGAEMHASISGTGEYLVDNDAQGIYYARNIISLLTKPKERNEEKEQIKSPLYNANELLGVVPVDEKVAYDVREIIARITDQSVFLEFKPDYDEYTICGNSQIHGHKCGIIGNNGPLSSHGAVKAAQFIQLCDQSNIAVIFIQNTTGFLVGLQEETSGIIKHGSKLIQAVANMHVPKISIMVGASYGAGNYAMCGRAMKPDFIFAWPNYQSCVMGGKQASKVLEIITEAKFKKMKKTIPSEMIKTMKKQVEEQFDRMSQPLYCSARLFDDGLIYPPDTRKILGMTLDICKEAKLRKTYPNTFGIARL